MHELYSMHEAVHGEVMAEEVYVITEYGKP